MSSVPGDDDNKRSGALAETAASDPGAEPTLAAPLPSPALAETVGDDAVDAPAMSIQRVDRYLIKRRLGAGGMGVVYAASDPELDRDVAIKMLKRGASAERLRREAQALAKLAHPNVVSVYDVGEHDGQVFVTMALVDGSNLRDWLAQDRTTDEILRVLHAAARGIIAAHEAGLVHRDLKPDNIFVAKDGGVQVGDFGLATDSDEVLPKGAPSHAVAAMSLTQTGHILGTPAYMAPEQAEGEASERSDQFSFCVTAYEALYGTRPFLGHSMVEILDRVESGEIAKPTRPRDVPREVAAAIRRGLAADPAQRFASMQELVEAMTIVPRPRRWPWIAGVAAVAGAGLATFFLTREAEPDPVTTCAPHRQDLDAVWNATRRAGLIADVSTTSRAYAEDVAKRFDEYAAKWTAARIEACTDELAGVVPPARTAARVQCLAINRVSFEEAIRAVAGRLGQALPQIVVALPSIDACATQDAERLAVMGEEHIELMRELTRVAYTGELEVFATLRAHAEKLDDRPAQLEIALTEARRALDVSRFEVAESALQRAITLAEALDIAGARARVLALFAFSRCAQERSPESYLAMAESATGKLDRETYVLEYVQLLEARARCAFRQDRAASIPMYEELFAYELTRFGAETPRLLERRGVLASLYRLAGREAEARVHEAEIDRVLGDKLGDRLSAAQRLLREAHELFVAGDVDRAIELQLQGANLFPTAPRGDLRADAFRSLALFYEIRVEWRLAAQAHGEVITAYEQLRDNDQATPRLAEAYAHRGYARLQLGEVEPAAQDFERALALGSQPDGEVTALAKLGQGRVWVARGEPQRGLGPLREGLAMFAALGPDASQFRIGVAQFALARALWDLGQQPAARDMARQAETSIALGLEQSRKTPLGRFGIPSRQAQLDELVRWRDAHR